MRTLPLVVLAGIALLVAPAPGAGATHSGPCTHEYFDYAFYAVENLKTGGPALFVAAVVYCATHPGGDVGPLVLP